LGLVVVLASCHVTRLASRVFRWLPGFWKNLCSPDTDEGYLENGVLEKIFGLKSKQWKVKTQDT
jgi:hypothetical protein